MPEQRKVVTATPENSETPLESVRGWVTPTRLFFVRNHFPVPELDVSTWRLSVEGCVGKPRRWTWDELTELPEKTVFATVECAGNGRSFLSQHVHGVQWGAGAVGHAEWTGVPLRLVLQESGIRPEALEVLFEGADHGSEADHPEDMQFTRSLPLDKALSPDTLLVYRMNGETLEPAHGYPLRLFVPGWYGVASVKWLRRIEVIDRSFKGYYQSVKYTIRRQTSSGIETVIIGPMEVKSEILRPRADSVLGVGLNRVCGLAWASDDPVTRVEVSTDGGNTWGEAELVGPQAAYSWTLWEYLWEVAKPGPYELLSRAISRSGQVQPKEHDPLCGGYHIHFSRPVRVRVETARRSQDQTGDLTALFYDMNAFAEENHRLPLDVELIFMGGEGI
jgi:DMSO/TMAO reductase YedYZ molybdopterin-dependent catalytic subunit